jgi:hypothetical protein
MEVVFRMTPPGRMRARAALVRKKVPKTFVRKVCSNSSSGISSSEGWVIWKPALLTTISTPPSSRTARSTSERAYCASPMSPGWARTFRPQDRAIANTSFASLSSSPR